jgi:hypothetical protein
MESKVINPTIIYGMNYIFYGITFVTYPRNVFLAGNTG